jgi:ribosomal protein L22
MGWFEVMKDAFTVADQLRNLELKQKLIDIQLEFSKEEEEKVAIRRELRALREQVRQRLIMQFKENVYWRDIGEGKIEGPFCPKCLDGDE